MLLELILLSIGGQFAVTTGELFETQFYCLHSGTAINAGYAHQHPGRERAISPLEIVLVMWDPVGGAILSQLISMIRHPNSSRKPGILSAK